MTDVNAPTLLEFTADQAREHTDKIRSWAEVGWELIRDAYQRRAWAVLGYQTWDEYCHTEFGGVRLRLPREDRPQVVSSLREAGLSTRAIASATGVDQSTVVRDLGRSDANASVGPARVTGLDGKERPSTRPAFQPGSSPFRPPLPPPAATPPEPQQEPSPAVTEWLDSDSGLQDLRYLAEFAKTLARCDDFMEFDADKVGCLADHDLWSSMEQLAEQANRFVDTGRRARRSLRVVGEQR